MSDPKLMTLSRTAPRRHYEAYLFLCDTIVEMSDVSSDTGQHHLSPREVNAGVIEHAVYLFGMMAPTVFKIWGIDSSFDIGDMVMLLIDAEVLCGTPDDSREAFDLDMHELFHKATSRYRLLL